MNNGNTFTVSNIDGVFDSYGEAKSAWANAGAPTDVGSTTWITEHDAEGNTVRTITIAPAVRWVKG